MEDVKSSKVQALEQSLINFLTGKKELEEKLGASFRRIRTIQLSFNDKNPKHITFSVQIGMFCAEFNITNALKEKGSCLGLERYIRDWAERDSVKSEMYEITNINTSGASANIKTNVRNTLR